MRPRPPVTCRRPRGARLLRPPVSEHLVDGPLLQARGVEVTYGGRGRKRGHVVLQNLDLEVAAAGNSNVVDVYVRYVRNRIHDTEESRIIETVRGIGYVIRDKTRKE